MSRLRRIGLAAALLAAVALAACSPAAAPSPAPDTGSPAAADTVAEMDRIAREYVALVLELGTHDEGYVDAYYGPAEWREAAEAEPRSVEAIRDAAGALAEEVAGLPRPAGEGGDAELLALRRDYLGKQLRAVAARARMLAGERFSFDEESALLYDAVAPTHDAAHFERLIAEVEGAVPGEGPLPERLARWRADFVIPPERLGAVFDAAIAECRRRTLAHVDLPPEEGFRVEYVSGRPWSAYNWYQGDAQSLIQVNTELPIYVDRAIDLACHEGYPGHHVYNALLEKHLVDDRGWVELSVYPLYSPQSLIAEGTANYGIEVAFPGDERQAFERETLFPLAGLDPGRVDEYYRVLDLLEGLDYAGNEAARRYLDGAIDREEAAGWLVRYALSTPERAEQRVRFFDAYRSYVINYNLGRDLVRRWVEARGGTADDPARRWQVFEELLSTPRVPSGLAETE
ncbi:MAG TPA: hypothetical protein VHM02_12095 [Thermoanaerobaculia bacterium]|nr:hypothetical protein [Thermoanaerobaculia bacterium]